ncbi:MAG TPA: hypothetical protein ENI23_17320 [bacterium]|nr:hypothetical protein [bacterium]
MPHLENWSVVSRTENPYQAPEQGIVSLSGIITGHSTLSDGSPATTSRIIRLDVDGKTASTKSGSEYTLGEIDPLFLEYVQALNKKLSDYNFPKISLKATQVMFQCRQEGCDGHLILTDFHHGEHGNQCNGYCDTCGQQYGNMTKMGKYTLVNTRIDIP